MLDKLINWSVTNRLLVIAASAALLIWGAVEFVRMPVDVFPDLTAPTVTIMTDAHDMSPEDVELRITYPIESGLNGINGVRRIRSTSDLGSSVVRVDFDWNTDVYRARQLVSERLSVIASQLPKEADQPVIAPISSVMGEIAFIGITSDDRSPMEVRTLAEWNVRPRLAAVQGVSKVTVFGGDVKQYQVLLDPRKLTSYEVAVDEVLLALGTGNENRSAGFFTAGGKDLLIYGIGRYADVSDIGATVVKRNNLVPVLVSDLGEVTIGTAFKRGTASLNAEPAILLGVQKQPTADTLKVTATLDSILSDIQEELPSGTRIHREVFRQADFIESSLNNMNAAIRDGAILVVLVIIIFVASARATFITALAIPMSLAVSVLVMKFLGESVNTMTLGGMAIAVGALVDDAIIGAENVTRRLRIRNGMPEEDRRPLVVEVYEAIKEIRNSIVFATLIIVLTFLPLFFLSGVEGRLLEPLGMAYIVALFASLGVSLVLTPALSYLLLPGSRSVKRAREPLTVRACKRAFSPLLDAAMKHWKLLSLSSLILLLGACTYLFVSGRAFLPEFNEGTLTLSTALPPGTALEEADEVNRNIEKLLLSYPEVVSTARRQGRDELDDHGLTPNTAEIDVLLSSKGDGEDALLEKLRQAVDQIPGLSVVIGQPISHRIDHMLSGTRANIAVKIFGPDLEELRNISSQIKEAMAGIQGVVDLTVEQLANVPQINVRYDRRALARHGLSAKEVSTALETAFDGVKATEIIHGETRFDLLVKYPRDLYGDVSTIENTMVVTPSGVSVPFSALAEVVRVASPNRINREDVRRKIVVSCNVAGRDLGSVANEIRERIDQKVNKPKGYSIALSGQFETAQKTTGILLLLGSGAVLGIFFLLTMAFKSTKDAALVMLNLPLALIGGVAGVHVFDGTVSIASTIGFISLFGIATRNGIMMVGHIRRLVTTGEEKEIGKACRRGAMERLSPILMTALASALGLLPLALAAGQPGAEIQAPMALVMLFGLISSTLLNLLVIPAVYAHFGALSKGQPAPN